MDKRDKRKVPQRGRALGTLPDAERCLATSKATRQRCKKPRMIGLTVCDVHGGSTLSCRNVNIREKFMRSYGNNLVADDHVGANPVSGIAWEMRRTAGNIIAIEEELAALREGELVQAESTMMRRALQDELRELVGDVEDAPPARPGESYTVVKREQTLHVWGELYLRERKHYADLVRLAFAVGFEKRRIDLMQEQVADLNSVITGMLRALGHDPNDPGVRAVVRQQIISVMPVPA
jgi:hypothetical protein